MSRTNKISRYARTIARDVRAVAERQRNFHRVRPVTSLLFLTYRCNSRCSTCTLWKRPYREEEKRELDLEQWKTIIDTLADAGVRAAEVFGGNVLLRKDVLIPLLRYLKEKDFVVHLPTNQIGLDDAVADAINSFVDFVYISTDGVGEHQDAIRGLKGSAQRVESAIAKLVQRRDGAASPRLICNTTVSKYNVGVLEPVVEYALQMGFDELHFEYAGEISEEHLERSVIEGLVPTPYYLKQEESILVDPAGARRLKKELREIRRKYAKSRIHVVTTNIDVLSERDLYMGTIPHDKCYTERLEVTVDPAGNVVPCAFINNYVNGNLLDEDFRDVWNGERHRAFREHQNGGAIEMCRHCILGVERNPGVWTSLRRIYLRRLVPVAYRLLAKM